MICGNDWFIQNRFLFYLNMKFIVGKKIAMTQLWKGETVVPVTQVEVGPCTVLQLKNMESDGYKAVQVGYGRRRSGLITKPLRGHFKNFGDFRFVREFRVEDKDISADLKAGDKITVRTFAEGDKLTVTGTSKGKGFQGVVKRHGFHGQDATHGNKDQLRASGSVGAGGVQHVFKGTRMGGRTGGDRVTLHDVEIVSIDESTNSLYIKGAVPGARNGLILLSADGELVLGDPEVIVEAPVAEENTEEITPEENVEATETVEEKVTETEAASEQPAEEVKVEETPEEKIETASEEAPEESAPASDEASADKKVN